MDIVLIGHGKMGQIIEKIALERGHNVVLIISENNKEALHFSEFRNADVAIEFTQPESAIEHIKACSEAKLPIVVGTTGWYNDYDKAVKLIQANDSAMIAATNFSVGVNLFFEINKKVAALMQKHKTYKPHVLEIHHIHKKDAPSGTAITLAEGVIENYETINEWALKTNDQVISGSTLSITAERTDEVPGTHTITYNSGIDEISLSHVAHNREGFALGAVIAAEFLVGKKGIFGMKEVLGI